MFCLVIDCWGVIAKQYGAFLLRINISSCPRPEFWSSILSWFQQYNKITNKIKVSHVWCTAKPTELALITDYHCGTRSTNKKQCHWQQHNYVLAHEFCVLLLSLVNSCPAERSRPIHLHSLQCLFLRFLSSRLRSQILLGLMLTMSWNFLLNCCHSPTIIICRSGCMLL